MIRFGYFTSAAAALALAGNLAFTAPAAAHDSGSDAARAIAGLIALGIIVKSLDNHNQGHHSGSYSYQPRSYSHPHRPRHHAGHHRHHYRGIHRHRSRHGGYYRHRH
ncbi:hypothetical protein RA19_20375 [Leisingera sp. ANG-M1]|uniref:hypothetical protein n=1 Tax=Leisingera sp. ANG-M1 TaxID=1577895 RepID=UPI00057F67D3|nr:hypothetical protein [Leisingera sp. ANG-M1]KIC08331.1 hypothetical protein RA19_20375 [Leisingera sp. ANG-M1]